MSNVNNIYIVKTVNLLKKLCMLGVIQMSTFERVQKIICEQLELDEHLVTEDATIAGDLSADSLDLVDLAMSIEDEFELEVPDEALESIKTVGDIVKFIDDNE